MRPIPFPVLTGDHQPHIVRAHRLRGAVAALPATLPRYADCLATLTKGLR